MKYLILLLFTLSLNAQTILKGDRSSYWSGAPAGCSTPTGSILSEGFEGTGYEDGMADGLGTPNEDETTFLAAAPSGVCTYALRTTTVDGAESFALWTAGNDSILLASTTFNTDFAFYIDSATDWEAFGNTPLITWDDDTQASNYLAGLRLRYDGGAWTFYLVSTVTSSYVTIAHDTWYEVQVHFDSGTPGNSYMGIVGVDTVNFTHNNEIIRYMRVGTSNIGGDDDVDMVTGYITIDVP